MTLILALVRPVDLFIVSRFKMSFHCANGSTVASPVMAGTESILNTILKELYDEKRMPDGGILDVGAFGWSLD